MLGLGVLCGTGMQKLHDSLPTDSGWTLIGSDSVRSATPWGAVPAEIIRLQCDSGRASIMFVQRHHSTDGRTIPPHAIEHRANVHAVLSNSPAVVVSINAVGSLIAELPPGSIGIAAHSLDLTGRVWTFHESDAVHADMTQHFDLDLSEVCRKAMATIQQSVPDVVVAQMAGPQFESPAEVEAIRRLGGDVVGMTQAPESALLSEARDHPERRPGAIPAAPEVRHVGLAVCSNWAAGTTPGDPAADIEHASVEAFAGTLHQRIWCCLLGLLDALIEPED